MRAAAVSVTVSTPSGPPSAFTWISRKSFGVPTPPLPETPPIPLLPAVMVMLRPITSLAKGSVPRVPVPSSASSTAAGELRVTSPPVDQIRPARRLPCFSVSTMNPFVCMMILPTLSEAAIAAEVSMSLSVASTLVNAVKVTTLPVSVWLMMMSLPALASPAPEVPNL